MKILYVDDNPADLFILKDLFAGKGHEVFTTTSVSVFMEQYYTGSYDIGLVDMIMKTMLGSEVVSLAKDANIKTKLYIISGMNKECVESLCGDKVDGVISKENLIEFVESVSK